MYEANTIKKWDGKVIELITHFKSNIYKIYELFIENDEYLLDSVDELEDFTYSDLLYKIVYSLLMRIYKLLIFKQKLKFDLVYFRCLVKTIYNSIYKNEIDKFEDTLTMYIYLFALIIKQKFDDENNKKSILRDLNSRLLYI